MPLTKFYNLPPKASRSLTFDEKCILMEKIHVGDKFEDEGNIYEVIRNIPGHWWDWCCQKQDGYMLSIHICDLLSMKKI